ncbi:MAG: thioredoxin family protein [Acidobacteria bacterium]|nr:thioredoxin family protein [Acidobacteriota bacterium]
MSKKRTIEIFTAGCPICNETVDLVMKAVASCGCEVIERPCTDTVCCDQARRYAITAVPTLVVDGVVVFQGKPMEAQAATMLKVA